MSEQTRKWVKLLDGWGNQQVSKKFQCPYCQKKFITLAGAQGHWASKHKRYGKSKPVYESSKPVTKSISKKLQLKRAQQKAAKDVKARNHRSVEDCQKEIAAYESALEEMTAEEYKVKSGISKQAIQRMRRKVKQSKRG